MWKWVEGESPCRSQMGPLDAYISWSLQKMLRLSWCQETSSSWQPQAQTGASSIHSLLPQAFSHKALSILLLQFLFRRSLSLCYYVPHEGLSHFIPQPVSTLFIHSPLWWKIRKHFLTSTVVFRKFYIAKIISKGWFYSFSTFLSSTSFRSVYMVIPFHSHNNSE